MRYVVRRLLLVIPTLAALSVFVFLLLHLVPGDPARDLLGLSATEQQVQHVRQELHLEESLPSQFLNWSEGLLHGDLGHDYASGTPVTTRLGTALPTTIELALAVVLLGAVVGIGIGALAGTRRRRTGKAVQGFVVLGTAIPEFWMGIMLVLLFTTALELLPPTGYVSLASEPVENLRHILLPVVSLAVFQAAYFARATRTAIEEALAAPSIVFLRAKGISERRILWIHALRNASAPIVTVVGLQLGAILGGVIVIETLFDLPGVGKLLYESITTRDYLVVQGCVLVIAVIFVLVNLITDLIVSWLDPRIGDGVVR